MTPPWTDPSARRWETRLLAVVTATLVVFGLANTYGASSLVRTEGGIVGGSFALRQFIGALVGGLAMVVISRMDYRRLQPLAWPLLLGTIGLLIIPLLPFTRAIAPVLNGARRWVLLGPLTVQPSEAAKVALVIWCAMLAAKKGDQIRQFNKGMLPFLLVVGFVSLLILLEPNLSMAVLVALTGGIIIWSAGAKIGHFLLLAPATILLGLHLIQSPSYQGNRIRNFINSFLNGGDPTSQIHQSLVGFGSGRFLGVGFGEGQQKFGYLPLAYSDFIFSAIGEEWGFLGAVFLVLLFALFCWLGFRIARSAEDPFGQYLAAGLTAAVGVTAAVHMAVCLSLMPTTGVTLPFVSYGRSSLLVTLLGTGVLLSVGRMRGKPSRVGRPPAQVRRPAARP